MSEDLLWREINFIKNLSKKLKPEMRPVIDYVPATVTLNIGDLTGGNVESVQTMFDGDTYDVDEVGPGVGFDIEFAFTGVTRVPRFVLARYKYSGSATHYVGIDIYNYDSVGWDQLHIFNTTNGYYENATKMIPLNIATDYTSSGAAIVRLYHYTGGNAAHDIMVDYVGLAH